jgi:hypothetical protein
LVAALAGAALRSEMPPTAAADSVAMAATFLLTDIACPFSDVE